MQVIDEPIIPANLLRVLSRYTVEELEEENQQTLGEMMLEQKSFPDKMELHKKLQEVLDKKNEATRKLTKKKSIDRDKCKALDMFFHWKYKESYKFIRSLGFTLVYDAIKDFGSLEEFKKKVIKFDNSQT